MKYQIKGYQFEIKKLSPEDGSGFLVTFPDLPGCMSDGENPREAIRNARVALLAWIEVRIDLQLPIPKPDGQNANSP